jgi:dUTP pyrophosphatase
MSKILIKKLHPDAILPSYSRDGDIGMDICSNVDVIIPARQRVIVSTGIAMALPANHAGLIWDRSGMAAKHGIKTMGGVIDPNYRGEWGIILYNTTDADYQVNKGDRIAQVLIQKVEILPLEEVVELPDSNRGDGGFGSSGK